MVKNTQIKTIITFLQLNLKSQRNQTGFILEFKRSVGHVRKGHPTLVKQADLIL